MMDGDENISSVPRGGHHKRIAEGQHRAVFVNKLYPGFVRGISHHFVCEFPQGAPMAESLIN